MTATTLTDIMIQPGANLLKEAYRQFSITAYNRMEPRARSENFDKSLRAEVRDPLWYLTRQWQMGEFEAEDAGSAIDARVVTQKIHIDRIALKGTDGRAYSEAIPMEALVEREAIPFTLALKIQVAQYFLKLHSPALSAKYVSKYLTLYPIEAGKEADYKGQVDGLNLYTSVYKRAFDGQKLYADIAAGTFKTNAGIIDPGDEAAINLIIPVFQSWYARQYTQPAQPGDVAWIPEHLSYNVSIAAPDAFQSQVVLSSDHYHQGQLDWFDFDEVQNGPSLSIDYPAQASTPETADPLSFIPNAAGFKGMPNPRFWEMEEGQVNFGKLNAKTTDHLLLSFAEFGLIYANDWFVIPYKMPVNTLCEITGFVVTDVFGERTLIQAADAGADSDWQRWSLFNISNKDQIGNYNRQFFLPSTLTRTLQSDPIEQVNFVRDEMANMVWGIEDTIPDATGVGINGHDAADKAGVLPEPIDNSVANIRYLLGTTVPENWIPFLPVHAPGSNQSIRFQRAAMPKLGVPPKDVVKAKGVLLQEVQPHFFINEEEIPDSGTLVTRYYQRARWYNGKTFLWIGRRTQTGKGEGNSKLAFDQITSLKGTS
ncbi:MAG: hypothetical protein J7539_03400 [Niabella sp.]|nr:hypothetical protein [Niabella sp.]